MVINRFEVWLIRLDPTLGTEIKKTALRGRIAG